MFSIVKKLSKNDKKRILYIFLSNMKKNIYPYKEDWYKTNRSGKGKGFELKNVFKFRRTFSNVR